MADLVQAHYTTNDLGARILAALQEAGYEVDPLDPEALSALEEFHTLGRLASMTLAEQAEIRAEDRVLDVGSGIGGPARFLARTFGCQVTGIDLTEEFCEVAQDLNRRCGLDGQITIRQGDALDLPFEDGAFDVVWTQHVAMNIADKARLYSEMHRVLVPGGRLAFFDIVGGSVAPLHFPVPWAGTEEASHLVPTDGVRRLVEAAGFTVTGQEDPTEDAVAFFQAMADTPPASTGLGLHLMIPDFPTKAANLVANLTEDRARLMRCTATAAR